MNHRDATETVSRETWHPEQEAWALKPGSVFAPPGDDRETPPSGGSVTDTLRSLSIVSGRAKVNFSKKKVIARIWKTKVNHSFVDSLGGSTWPRRSLSDQGLREREMAVR